MNSKKELISTIEKQQEKLAKYETKLRDVVHAYRGLIKEKQALEASLFALNKPPNDSIPKKTENVKEENDNGSNCSEEKDENETSSVESSPEIINQLKNQIAVLTNSLSTLSGEKSRIESSFQADKKKLKTENEEYGKRLEEEIQSNKTLYETTVLELNNLKTKFKINQQERDKEESHHSLMIRELQKLVSSERMSKECLQEKLEETKAELKKHEMGSDKIAEYERKLQMMAEELCSVRERLKITEDMANKPSPMLVDLQNQMSEMREQHHISYEKEKSRANEAEKLLTNGSNANESRVAALELRLTELSDMIGNYDRMKMKDQTAIAKLKDRISQLDMENSALTKSSIKNSNCTCNGTKEISDSNLSIEEMISKITKLKYSLKIVNQKADIPVNLDELLKTDFLNSVQLNNQNEDLHHNCRFELKKLNEEFEKYKSKTQSALKAKNYKEDASSKEVNQLHNQLAEMKDKISIMKTQYEEENDSLEETIKDLKNQLKSNEIFYQKNIFDVEDSYKRKIVHLEDQMQKQRERSITVLEEREMELKNLRSLNLNNVVTENTEASESSGKNSDGCGNEVIHMLENSKKSTRNETQIFHYQHEIARLEMEIKSLRKAKHELELGYRELANKTTCKEEKYSDEIEELKAKFNRIETSVQTPTNLEYLKNVVLNFIKSTNPEGKMHMVNAIAAVLHFTPKEYATVKKYC